MPINSFFQKGGALSRLGALANKYVVTTDWSDPYKEKQMKLRNKLSRPNIFPVYNFLISLCQETSKHKFLNHNRHLPDLSP